MTHKCCLLYFIRCNINPYIVTHIVYFWTTSKYFIILQLVHNEILNKLII